MRQVYDTLTEHGYKVALAAPTGKAAKRIRELTEIPAMTLHRLLEYTSPGEIDPDTGKPSFVSFPRRNMERPLDQDVVIVDEYSMVNRDLHRNLMDAIGDGAVRCFGDANQLPPIEEDSKYTGPSPFQTLLKDWPSIKLTKIFRQGEGSIIVENGARILRGQPAVPDPASFVLKLSDMPLSQLSKILERCRGRGTDEALFDTIDYQVITPQKKSKLGSQTTVGTHVLNKLMCELYTDPMADSIEIEHWPWELKANPGMERFRTIAVGQKIINVKNIYDLRPYMSDRFEGQDEAGNWVGHIPPQPHEEIYNGEAGIVVGLDGGRIDVDLGDRIVSIPTILEYFDERGNVRTTDPRRHLEHGYAITTHKSQGSEYEGIIYFISGGASMNQCRANYYTAITRAKKQVVVVGDRRSVSQFSLKEKPGW
jgi:exodeoxyribonuclease V alpha subunit